MILGIGTDLIDGRRIEAALERHKDRFAKRIFTIAELNAANKAANPITKHLVHQGLPVVAGRRLKPSLGLMGHLM